jgi:glutamate dehydrogenase
VVGEGGNLGFTQKGRIEFARSGGRINTDFIDNSAGVDCSDHEVNIKILLNKVVDQGELTMKQRDRLLAEMTDEVGALVLRNNILQVQAISLAETRHHDLLDSQTAFIRRLEASGRLNRELEVLPDDETLGQRRQSGQGLQRPEIAVIVAYAKMTLYDDLLASDLPDDAYLVRDLVKYFPRPLRRRFRDQIEAHRLRREITATLVANSIVNRGLGEFVGEMGERTGLPPAAVARAYLVARDAFALVPVLGQLEHLTARIGAPQQIRLVGKARDALARGTQWFLRNLAAPIEIRAAVDRFGPGISTLTGQLDSVLEEAERGAFNLAVEGYLGQGIEPEMSRQLAAMPYLFPACEVVAVAEEVGVDVAAAGKVYFVLDAKLRLGRLQEMIERGTPRSHWERHALDGLHDDLFREHRRLTVEALVDRRVMAQAKRARGAIEEAVSGWLQSAVPGFARWQRILSELESQPGADLAMLSVVTRTLAGLSGRAPRQPDTATVAA